MILNLPVASEHRSVLIGIDGFGGSGKTTFAQDMFVQKKGTALLHLDDFIYPNETRYTTDYEEWYCYYELQWRYDYLIQHLLEPLKNGRAIKQPIQLYKKDTDCYVEMEVDIPLGSTVFIEGVFLQRPLLRNYFDYTIFLDVDKETRLKRVIERDHYIGSKESIINKYKHRYFPAEERYMEECQPLSLADYILR